MSYASKFLYPGNTPTNDFFADKKILSNFHESPLTLPANQKRPLANPNALTQMIGYAYGKLIISEPKGSPYIYILYTKNSLEKNSIFGTWYF